MKIIFCDSTLNKEDISSDIRLDYVFMPSIKRGDLITLINCYNDVEEIIIVDGVFDQAPSITHKEILYVISKNIKVVGISSMGALRAAELYKYGMIGSGEIFKSYLDGKINSDEEVAVSFIKKNGKIYKTVPLVNIRKTLEVYKLNNVIYKNAEKIFYKQRSWGKLKKELSQEEYGLLKSYYIDQKKQDVINYLQTGNQFKCDLTDIKYYNHQSIYILNEIAKFDGKGVLGFIIKIIKHKYSYNSYNSKKVDDLIIFISKFIGISEDYARVIQFYLLKVNEIHINNQNISQFKKLVLKELNIMNKENLLYYLDNMRINKIHLEDIFVNLYKLYKILIKECYSKTSSLLTMF